MLTVYRPDPDVKPTPSPKQSGFAMVPHEETARRDLSDAGFRAWVALQQWAWNGRFPTNGQLAMACGWCNAQGKPSAGKARRVLRELETAGMVQRVTTKDTAGCHRRAGIEVAGGYLKFEAGGYLKFDPL